MEQNHAWLGYLGCHLCQVFVHTLNLQPCKIGFMSVCLGKCSRKHFPSHQNPDLCSAMNSSAFSNASIFPLGGLMFCFFKIYVCVCLHMYVYMFVNVRSYTLFISMYVSDWVLSVSHMCWYTQGSQKRASEPLYLELQAVGTAHTVASWMLGSELGSSPSTLCL